MKNVFFFLLLTFATIWACTKESTPAPVAPPSKSDNTAVTERTDFVRFLNGAGLKLCGVVPDANACTTCGNVNYGFLVLPSANELVTLPYGEFCLTNKTGAAVTVTMQVPSCVGGAITVTIPPGRTYCYSIAGCILTLTGTC